MGYLVSTQFFEERGDLEQGQRSFLPGSTAAPVMTTRPAVHRGRSAMAGRMTSFEMVAALWKHGPAMLSRMRLKRDFLASVQRLGDGRPGGIPLRLQVETTAAIGRFRPASVTSLPKPIPEPVLRDPPQLPFREPERPRRRGAAPATKTAVPEP